MHTSVKLSLICVISYAIILFLGMILELHFPALDKCPDMYAPHRGRKDTLSSVSKSVCLVTQVNFSTISGQDQPFAGI